MPHETKIGMEFLKFAGKMYENDIFHIGCHLISQERVETVNKGWP